ARWRAATGASTACAALTVVSIAAGLMHITGIVRSVGPFSPLGIHVAAAVGAAVVGVVPVLPRRVRPPANARPRGAASGPRSGDRPLAPDPAQERGGPGWGRGRVAVDRRSPPRGRRVRR